MANWRLRLIGLSLGRLLWETNGQRGLANENLTMSPGGTCGLGFLLHGESCHRLPRGGRPLLWHAGGWPYVAGTVVPAYHGVLPTGAWPQPPAG